MPPKRTKPSKEVKSSPIKSNRSNRNNDISRSVVPLPPPPPPPRLLQPAYPLSAIPPFRSSQHNRNSDYTASPLPNPFPLLSTNSTAPLRPRLAPLSQNQVPSSLFPLNSRLRLLQPPPNTYHPRIELEGVNARQFLLPGRDNDNIWNQGNATAGPSGSRNGVFIDRREERNVPDSSTANATNLISTFLPRSPSPIKRPLKRRRSPPPPSRVLRSVSRRLIESPESEEREEEEETYNPESSHGSEYGRNGQLMNQQSSDELEHGESDEYEINEKSEYGENVELIDQECSDESEHGEGGDHEHKHYDPEEFERVRDPISGIMKFKCPLCKTKPWSAANFARDVEAHMQKHYGERTFVCSICRFAFLSKRELTKHNQKVDCGNKKKKIKKPKALTRRKPERKHLRTCPNCQAKPFATTVRRSFEDHMRRHDDETSFACDVCNQSFNTRTSLLLHLKTHHKSHECETCQRVFDGALLLGRHQLEAHPADFPFVCKTCSRRFLKRFILTYHEASHTRPFVCGTCGATFITRHSVGVHEGNSQCQRNAVEGYDFKSRPSCKRCKKTFKNATTLKHHHNRTSARCKNLPIPAPSASAEEDPSSDEVEDLPPRKRSKK